VRVRVRVCVQLRYGRIYKNGNCTF